MDDFYLQLGLWFEQNVGPALGLLSGFTVVLVFYVVYLHVRLSRMLSRLYGLLEDVDGQNLEELLVAQGIQLREVLQELTQVKQKYQSLQGQLSERLTSPVVARYSAFENTGSNQSFSVALLDGHGNGAVLTGLHGRNESRTYAKPIINGESRYVLTEEEHQAIRSALEQIGLSKEDLAAAGRNASDIEAD